MTRMHYVISYDVSSSSRRRKIGKILEGAGRRAQYSVFEADLTKAGLQGVVKNLKGQFSDGDTLRIYPVCGSCLKGLVSLGKNRFLETGVFILE